MFFQIPQASGDSESNLGIAKYFKLEGETAA